MDAAPSSVVETSPGADGTAPAVAPAGYTSGTVEPIVVPTDLVVQLRKTGESILGSARDLIECPQLSPQQAMGAITKLADVICRLLCSLEDPEGRAKFSRIRASALRKMLGAAADVALPLLSLGGFVTEGEHFVWVESSGSLLAALSLQASIFALQQRFQNGGARAIHALDDLVLVPSMLLSATLNTTLLPRSGPVAANSVGAALLQRVWLAEQAPELAALLGEFPDLAKAADARERAAKSQMRRELTVLREASNLQGRLICAPLLEELAQLIAGFQLMLRRRQGKLTAETTYDVPPALTAGEASTSAATVPETVPRTSMSAGDILNTLLPCVPAFRLKPPTALLTEFVFLREYPSFFTAGMNEKQYASSLESLAREVIASMSSKRDSPLLGTDWTVLGLGCFSEITHDEGMQVVAILA